MELLLGIVCLVILIILLSRKNTAAAEIDLLKKRLDKLEDQLAETRRASQAVLKPEPMPRPGPGTAHPFSAVLPKPQPAPASEPVLTQPQPGQPPPLRAAAKTQAVPQKVQTLPPPIPKAPRPGISDFLRGIGLWPPERKEGSSEVVLMQWWTPRIGGGLAILSIIFFAVYVAQGTPPWVKFAEMVAASFGVFGLGLFFSKKRPGIGNVLIATGLSMVYISSVAGYAVGPVKVVDNPIVGALMQLAALILNFGMGVRKKERGILILALIFGYVSSLFAALEGFREAALISSLLIYLAGLASYRRIGGLTLMSLSLAGVYLPLAGFIGIEFIKDAPVYPLFWSVIVFLVLTVSVLPACRIFLKEPDFLDAKWNRLYQSLNTTLALGLGFLFVHHFYPLGKTEFYGVLAILFVAWSLFWFARDNKGIEFHLFFLKGSALTTLWFINYYHGDLRWMALGVQVIILAASAHRSKSVWIEVITGLTWLVSYRYYIETGFHEPEGSFLWAIQGLYVLVSVAGLGYLMAYARGRQKLRRVIYTVPAVMLAVVAVWYAAESNFSKLDEPAIVAMMGFLVLLISLVPGVRGWIPILAGGFVFVVSHLMFWIESSGLYTLLVVLFVSAVCLTGLLRTKVPRRDLLETGLHGLWVITVLFYLNTYQALAWYPVVIAVFSILLFFAGYSPLKRLPEVCALPLLFLLIHPPRGEYPGWLLYLFAILVGVLANVGIIWPRFRQFVLFLRRGDLLWWLLNSLFLYWASWVFSRSTSLINELLLWTALGLVFFSLWYWRSLWVSFVASLLCASVPVLRIVDLWQNPPRGGLLDGAPWAGQVLLAGLVSMALWLLIGGYSQVKSHPKYSQQGLTILAWVSGLAAYLVYAAAFDYPLLNWERLYTPLLGAFSIGLIILGIVLKSKPFRFVAMLTFAIPLFRLFVYDIRETLYRIVAFAVLAVVLTLVGFLYQKFSSRIE